jgi:hypothetical protein
MMRPIVNSSVISYPLQPIARVRVCDGNEEEEDRRDDEDYVQHVSTPPVEPMRSSESGKRVRAARTASNTLPPSATRA